MSKLCPQTGHECPMTYCPGCVPTLPHYTAPQTGWICPRCNKVHAPFVPSCHCQGIYPGGPNWSGGQGNAA